MGVLHFVTDEQDPAGIVAVFRDSLVPGSALAISHVVDDGDGVVSTATRQGARIYAETTAPVVVRARAQVASWLAGFRLVPPGLVNADAWQRTGTSKATAPVAAGVGLLLATDLACEPANSTSDREQPAAAARWPSDWRCRQR